MPCRLSVILMSLSSPDNIADERIKANQFHENILRDHLLKGSVAFRVESWDDRAIAGSLPAPQGSVSHRQLTPARTTRLAAQARSDDRRPNR